MIVLTLPLEFTAKFLDQQLSRFVILVVLVAFGYLVVKRRRTLVIPRFASVWLLLVLVIVSILSWLVTRAPGSTNTLLDIALYPFVGLLIANLVVTREDHRRGGHLTLAHPEADRLSRALRKRGVIPDFRPPDLLRFAPAPPRFHSE